jgi:hypothetical protein
MKYVEKQPPQGLDVMVVSSLLRRAAICLVMSSPSAFAQGGPEIPAGQNNDTEKATVQRMAKFYGPAAVTFKCPQFVWGSFLKDHVDIQIEYVPDGDNVASWTRLMTINLYPLPKDEAGEIDAAKKIEGTLLDNLKSGGKILDQRLYENSHGLPRLYVEYEVGEGVQQEHAAGAYLILAPNIASFVQIQTRGKPFDPNDAANMKLLVEGKLKFTSPN